MTERYTAQKVEGTKCGWLVINSDTGEKHLVFCNENKNAGNDAVSLVKDIPSDDPDK